MKFPLNGFAMGIITMLSFATAGLMAGKYTVVAIAGGIAVVMTLVVWKLTKFIKRLEVTLEEKA